MIRNVFAQLPQTLVTVGIVVCLLLLVPVALGSNIDPAEKWAWGTNVGWINVRPTHGGVTVYPDHLEGYAWGENIGWIRLGTHEGGGSHTYGNTSATDYGVNLDASGNLSGYAWGTNVGWIHFSPTHGGVTIDLDTGQFDGYAWGENIGWISFKGTGAVSYNVVARPDVTIDKQATARVDPGGTVTYTLHFSNTSPILATDVVITDHIPVSVTVTSVVSSGVAIADTGASPPYVWQVADLGLSEGGVITITGLVSHDLPGGHTFTNTAEIAADADCDGGNNRAHAAVTVTDARLHVTKEVSDPTPEPGATIVYTVIVTNIGPDDATGVVVSDTVPSDLIGVSSGATQGTYVDPVWNVGDLQLGVNPSATLHITGTVPANTPDRTVITNTAVIASSDQGDSGPADDRRADAVIVIHAAELAVTKTVDDCTPREGDTVTYAITVLNSGYTSTVVISDVLPSGLSYVSDDSPAYDGTGTWAAGEVGEDESATLHITATVDAGTAGTTITNTAAVSTTSLVDPDPTNDRAAVVIHAQAAEAAMATWDPAAGARLVFTDTQGMTTTIETPVGGVTDTIILVYTPISPTQPHKSGLRFANHVFDLAAYACPGCQPLSAYVFKQPVTVTIHYSDDDVAGLKEDGLLLTYWDGATWQDAACSAYAYHPDENWMQVPICHLTPFALSGPALPVGGVTMSTDGMPSYWLWPTVAALALGIAAVAVLIRRRRVRT